MKIASPIVILLLVAAAAFAQDDTIRVETNLVTLNVSVTDRQGNFVKGLSKGDFVILDNGLKQEVDTFSVQDAPVSFGVIYDSHASTGAQIPSVLDAIRKFAASLGSGDDIFVTVFNENGSLTTDFVPTEEQIRQQSDGSVKSLYDAIFVGSDKIAKSRNHKRVLLVLTDGADHSSHHSLKELKRHLRSVNLPVYAITFGGADKREFGYSDIFRDGARRSFPVGEASEMDRGVISEISKTSGGQTFEAGVRNRIYLPALFALVNQEVKGQYVLGFYADKQDGTYHKLKVSVAEQRQKRLRVSNRKGYQSPKRS